MPCYAGGKFELNWHQYHLEYTSETHIPFLLSLSDGRVPFAVLTRYLVLNTVTGMLHLFDHHLSEPESLKNGFFAPLSGYRPKLVREDIQRYMHCYITRALGAIGDCRPMHLRNPLQLLESMQKFWHLTGCAQDTIVICLEVQQLYLYLHLYRELESWYDLLPKLDYKLKFSSDHYKCLRKLRLMILYGAKFAYGSDASRIFFIDILVRRLLFWGCVDEITSCFPTEVASYAKLLAHKDVAVDSWQHIEFGNIDEHDQAPLVGAQAARYE